VSAASPQEEEDSESESRRKKSSKKAEYIDESFWHNDLQGMMHLPTKWAAKGTMFLPSQLCTQEMF